MKKSSFIALLILACVLVLAGCRNEPAQPAPTIAHTPEIAITAEPEISNVTDEKQIENTPAPVIDENFVSSKDDISIDLDFDIHVDSWQAHGEEGIEYLRLSFDNLGVDYYEVEINGRIFKVVDDSLILNEKYRNTLIENFAIRAYEWDGKLLNKSFYKNVMFFCPYTSTRLDDIECEISTISHLWIFGSQYDWQAPEPVAIDMINLREFTNLETLSLGNTMDYSNFNPSDIMYLMKLHTLIIGPYIDDFNFLNNLPYLRSLEISTNYEYDDEYDEFDNVDTLEKLNLYAPNILSLDLINHFPNLIELEIHSRSLENISAISNQKKLEKLTLENMYKLEIAETDTNPNLNTLIIDGTDMEDYSFLQYFNNVNELRIFDTDILDLSFLGEYNNLNILDLSESYSSLDNKENIEYIKNITSLKTLILPFWSYNPYADSFRSQKENKLKDISFIEELVNLEYLIIDVQCVNDTSPLGKLKNLKSLVVANVDDTSWINKNLYDLCSLTLLYASIDDFSKLRNLKELRKFHIYENYVYDSEGNINYDYKFDYSFLNDLHKLMYIEIYNFNMYFDMKDDKFPDLSNLDNLVLVVIGSMICSDISGMFNAENIEYISLVDCEFSDLNGIEKLSRLNVLDLILSIFSDEIREYIVSAFGDNLILLG